MLVTSVRYPHRWMRVRVDFGVVVVVVVAGLLAQPFRLIKSNPRVCDAGYWVHGNGCRKVPREP